MAFLLDVGIWLALLGGAITVGGKVYDWRRSRVLAIIAGLAALAIGIVAFDPIDRVLMQLHCRGAGVDYQRCLEGADEQPDWF